MILLALLALAAQPIETDVAVPDEADGLSGSVEATVANATGNTENLNVGLNGELNYEQARLTHNLNAAINYAESGQAGGQERETTQENFFAAYQLDAAVSDRAFAFGRLRYEQDAFSGFKRRVFVGAGYGYRVFESDTRNWKLVGGPGIRWVQIDDPVPDPLAGEVPEGGGQLTDFSVYASSEFEWDIRENVGIEHDATVTYTGPNTTFETEAALKTRLTDLLSARLSYFVRHETEPPLEREPTDTLLRAGIVLDF
jgi:putative salt-induced outer membrane protein